MSKSSGERFCLLVAWSVHAIVFLPIVVFYVLFSWSVFFFVFCFFCVGCFWSLWSVFLRYFLCSLRVILSMYWRYLQRWPFLFLFFSTLLMVNTAGPSLSSLGCKALCIVMCFLVLWSICCSSSLQLFFSWDFIHKTLKIEFWLGSTRAIKIWDCLNENQSS